MSGPTSAARHVSVCVCAYNGENLIGRAIESILAQSYGDFELLVVDDGSSDRTVEVVGQYRDDRIAVVRNERNLGEVRNRSRAISVSGGALVKFVDQDDWIEPTCLAEHVRVLDAHPGVGLTFSRRRVALEDETSEGARAWKQMYSEVHRAFGELREVNSGRAMLSRYVAAGLSGNWIGEQTCVMLRRACLFRSGLFNRRLRQLGDMDLWIRLMALFDVGFLDDELATRWVGSANETGANLATRREWLDRLWMLEGLKELPELWHAQSRLADMRRAERKSVVVALVTGRQRTTRLGEALADVEVYLRHVASAAIGGRESLFDRL